jgi:glycosyltransferase EpsJ
MNPILSLIIPVYKVESYVGACLDSILTALEQVEADESFEVFCIDDGSPDRSGEILEAYRERFAELPRADRVAYTVIHQPNAGVSVARNAGLDCATGEWLTLIPRRPCLAHLTA